MRSAAAIAMLALLPLSVSFADVYRSVDAQGHVLYSDTPSPGAELVKVTNSSQHFSSQFISSSSAPKQAAAQAGKKTTAAPTPPAQHGEGQRVFEQNCSRCHTAPSGFSSRIAGTVAMHMRVRASLSQDDTEALLHFLNP